MIQIKNLQDYKDKEIKDLFIKAENYRNEGKFLEAISCYDRILFHDEGICNPDVYLGIFLTWYKYCQSINANNSEFLYELYDITYRYLPEERKQEFEKFYLQCNDNLGGNVL